MAILCVLLGRGGKGAHPAPAPRAYLFCVPSVHLSVVVTATPGRNDHFIAPFLRSLFATSVGAPHALRVTLTDNTPGSDLGRRMQQEFPQITLIENTERRGYAANHNAALRDSDADYLVVANDDLEFVPGGLAHAIEVMEQPDNSRVGSAGMNLRNPDGSLQPSTYSFPGVFRILLDASSLRALIPFSGGMGVLARWVGRGGGRSRFWAHDRTLDVDTFRGAIVINRNSCVRAVGWMDESTLLGGEETDWHKRMMDAGWRILFIHHALVIHHGSQTIRVAPTLHAEFLKGAMGFIARHRARSTYRFLRWTLMVVLTARWLVARFRGPLERAQASLLLTTAWSWRAR